MKNSLGKAFFVLFNVFVFVFVFCFLFQILAKIEMTRNKNSLFGSHFETVQHFSKISLEIMVLIVHTYMVQISLQNSGGKVVFHTCPILVDLNI